MILQIRHSSLITRHRLLSLSLATCIALPALSALEGSLPKGQVPPLLAQSNPVPLINQPLVPEATAPGGPAFTLTVNGTGFVPGSTTSFRPYCSPHPFCRRLP